MLRFLYVSHTGRIERPYLDPSVRYRCYNPAEDIEHFGHLADVISFGAFDIDMIKNYDVFIFHRPPYDKKLEIALAVMDRYHKKYFADYDDLIFAPEYALESSLYKTGRADKRKVIDIFKKNFKAMRFFNNFTVSTEPLKELLLSLNKKKTISVNVIHNGLSSSWIERVESKSSIIQSTVKRISYLSGTKSHDHDFEIVQSILASQLSEKINLEVMLVGPLEYDKKLLTDKVRHLRYVEYEKLPEIIRKSWLNIAPLENNIFNRCKSGLKFFESAIFGIPSIVSPIPDFTRFSDSDIIIANTEQEWIDAIEKLYSDREYYQKISDSIKKYSKEYCLSTSQTKKFINIIESMK